MELLVRGSSLRSTVVKKQSRSHPSSPKVNTAARMYPEEEDDTDSSEEIEEPPARLAVRELEMKIDQLTESAMESSRPQELSLGPDLEEEIQTSLLLARKHGEERLETERRRHSDQLDSMEREVIVVHLIHYTYIETRLMAHNSPFMGLQLRLMFFKRGVIILVCLHVEPRLAMFILLF